MQTNGFQHWIHFIIIISNIWIHFIKNIFKNEMDPVFWVLFFSEALGPIPNWILFSTVKQCQVQTRARKREGTLIQWKYVTFTCSAKFPQTKKFHNSC